MSDKTTNPVITIADPNKAETDAVVEKQTFVQKVVAPFKKHPKIALAIGGGAALIGAAALAGRATAPSYDGVFIALEEPAEEMTEEDVESTDTTVA